jgi:hypothetical protein
MTRTKDEDAAWVAAQDECESRSMPPTASLRRFVFSFSGVAADFMGRPPSEFAAKVTFAEEAPPNSIRPVPSIVALPPLTAPSTTSVPLLASRVPEFVTLPMMVRLAPSAPIVPASVTTAPVIVFDPCSASIIDPCRAVTKPSAIVAFSRPTVELLPVRSQVGAFAAARPRCRRLAGSPPGGQVCSSPIQRSA